MCAVEHSRGRTWHRMRACSWYSNLAPADTTSRTSLKRESSVCPSETSAMILAARRSDWLNGNAGSECSIALFYWIVTSIGDSRKGTYFTQWVTTTAEYGGGLSSDMETRSRDKGKLDEGLERGKLIYVAGRTCMGDPAAALQPPVDQHVWDTCILPECISKWRAYLYNVTLSPTFITQHLHVIRHSEMKTSAHLNPNVALRFPGNWTVNRKNPS